MAILKFIDENEKFELIYELRREQGEKGLANRVHNLISALREKLSGGYSIDFTYIPDTKPDDFYIISIKGQLKKIRFVANVVKQVAEKQKLNFHL